MLPVVVCASLIIAEPPDLLRRRTPVDRLALYVISSWFSVGPALVLFFWASHPPRWSSWPIYVAALWAQFLFDYASNHMMMRRVASITALAQLRSVLPAFAVDALLAPLGLLVAFTASGRPWTFAWSAMTTDRSYRKALTGEAAAAELHACAGMHFDPAVVEALVAVLVEGPQPDFSQSG
jgi:hypothetical protein